MKGELEMALISRRPFMSGKKEAEATRLGLSV